MSVLDLFASALGGFIMIAIILFPSYMADKKLTAKLDEAQAQIEEQKEEIHTSKNALAEAAVLRDTMDKQIDALRLEIARTFLIISLEWDTPGVDIDLGVRDPDDHYYYFGRTNREGEDFDVAPAQTPVVEAGALQSAPTSIPSNAWAELSFDNRSGPGLELWQSPIAKPGVYQIIYKLYSAAYLAAGQDSIAVRGKIFYRNGREELPVQNMISGRNEVTVKIRVTDEGTIEIL
ncbi:hypothetical protein HFO77_29160 [Rhizobium leguminosarum]|uniref:hypothetical protein n=1 Tax=Rhizobium leguminosarum TaxID=384 RepID=UPI001C984E2F|nr:hypothetical protein [Rhizobium leguminosarum]MBY5918464.1 hypothetical protein [Rhizobium leguminosarum]